jgi:uncharacterized beta-barrel protein YwiB (DUF1934 family)
MTRDVEVNVTGVHARQGEPTEKVTSTVMGIFELLEDGSRIIEYDEDLDAGTDTLAVHNRVCIDSEGQNMEIVRTGATNATLRFGENLEYDTEYLTPYGAMTMKVRTVSFDMSQPVGDGELRVVAEYDLEIEGEVISSSMVVLDIKNAQAV